MELRRRRNLEGFERRPVRKTCPENLLWARRIFFGPIRATIVSRLRPENAPRFNVFSHNPTYDRPMRTMVVISILALLTITGAVISDQILTSGQPSTHRTN
jgi:hypothetical protein